LKLVLPTSVSRSDFERALLAFANVVGKEWVLASDADRFIYSDSYAIGDAEHIPSAAVCPINVEQIQEILRIANAYKIPLWPVSRGKNLGYGEAAPVLSGSVILDLARLNRIHEVNEKTGYAVLEPGVSFFDLFHYLQDNKIPLWLSVPGNALGSVIGNALERGLGYTPYGENTANLCGLEVVLPTGELIHTGMGAMANNKCWHNYPFGFGPHWDQLFVQSNFGVVTRAGIWLMPEPDATKSVKINLPDQGDIAWFIDEMSRLRVRGVFEQPLVCGNYLREAMVFSQRKDWYTAEGPIPDDVSKEIMQHFEVGWWSANLTLFGDTAVIEAQADLVRRAIEPRLKAPLRFETWRRGDPIERSGAGVPSLLSLQIVNWLGKRGGHVGFSPVVPPDGAAILNFCRQMQRRFEEFGFDYYGSFTLGRRHVRSINLIIFDLDDRDMMVRARKLFEAMVVDAAQQGFGEYRTHINFMQLIADTYGFNDHALIHLNEKTKDMLDPNGVLAPGKNGIWPRVYRADAQGGPR
jgi:4-cresol dehydrogenase (hydroxylating) flavoprotein subunit